MPRTARVAPALAAFAVVAVAAVLAPSARAQPAPAPTGATAEVTSLEAAIDRDYEALSTGDCSVACRALGSMRRATARLCALDPGPRCAAARAKLDDAQSRVRTACPGCSVDADAAPPGVGAAQTPEAADRREPAAAPPPESARGGCAGCEVGDARGPAGSGLLAALALLGLGLLRRRRR